MMILFISVTWVGDVILILVSSKRKKHSRRARERIFDLALLVDVKKYLSEINLKLQGKDKLGYQQFENVQALHLMRNNHVHFATRCDNEFIKIFVITCHLKK